MSRGSPPTGATSGGIERTAGVDEGPGGAEGDHEGVDGPERRCCRVGVPGQPGGGTRPRRAGRRGDATAVEAVGHRAGHRDEDERREELGQTEQAEVEVAAGQVVDLLAERGDLDEGGRRARHRGDEERDDGTVSQQVSCGRGGGVDGRNAIGGDRSRRRGRAVAQVRTRYS